MKLLPARILLLPLFATVIFFFSLINDAPAQCSNAGFELTPAGVYNTASAVSNWTVNSQTYNACTFLSTWQSGSPEFAIVSTPLSDPVIGILGNSPLGGTQVAKLNDGSPGSLATRISYAVSVSNMNPYFILAYAGAWQGGAHSCCAQCGFRIQLRTCAGATIACQNMDLSPSFINCPQTTSYNVSSGTYWCNWRTQTINLSAYTNSCVIIDVINNDCSLSDHAGYVYIDASCSALPNLYSGVSLITGPGNINPVSFCAGANAAYMCAPTGFATYSWFPPIASPPLPPAQATLQCLTVTNPIPGSVYTVQLGTGGGCIFVATYTLTFSQVSIANLLAAPSCSAGSSGSAIVLANGSGTGYNYTWTASNNSVVGTSSVAANLSPGQYTVTVTANGFSSCGTATAAINVPTATPGITSLAKPFCNSTAYLSTTGGSNFQWYNGNTLIPPPVGTAASLTVTNAVNGGIYWLGYTSAQNCRDSVKYTLLSTTPSSLQVMSNQTICAGGTNGQATFSIVPSGGISGNNLINAGSTGTTSTYSYSLFSPGNNTFALNTLSAYGTYSIQIFDGSCQYTSALTVPVHTFDFSIFPSGTITLCNGNSLQAGVQIQPASQSTMTSYSYSWSPNIYLAGNANTYPSTIISPVIAPNPSASIVYSITVSPTIASCPLTKTLNLRVYHAATPTVASTFTVCQFGPQFTVTAQPPGGTFGAAGWLNMAGVSNSFFIVPGINNYSYTYQFGPCQSSATGSVYALYHPQINISGPLITCAGQTVILNALSTYTFMWSTGSTASAISVSPASNTLITASNTYTNGCSFTATYSIQSAPVPTLSVFGSTSVCAGQTTTITASGANSYSWSTGSTSNSITQTVSQTSTIILTGSNNAACYSSVTIQLIALPNPTLVVPLIYNICAQDQKTVAFIGAISYSVNAVSIPSNTYVLNSNSPFQFVLTGATTDNCRTDKLITVSVTPCTSLNEVTENRVLLFPNPGQGLYQLVGENNYHCRILDMLGHLTYEAPVSDLLDLRQLPDGIYLAEFYNGSETKRLRLILEKK